MMKKKKIGRRVSSLVLVCLCCITHLVAQDDSNAAGAAQANNSLANMTVLNFHDYYTPKLTEAPSEAHLNTAWIRFARPFSGGKLLLRVSVPLSTVGAHNTNTGIVHSSNGLSDINAFVSYNFISKPNATVGIGPLLALPTATDDQLGSGKWQGGLAFVAFIVHSPVFQLGGLVTWQASFAGDDARSGTNLLAIQPFYFWQLGKGTYLRGAPIWAFDLANDAFSMPLGLGIGKVVKVGNTVFNLFLEPIAPAVSEISKIRRTFLTGTSSEFSLLKSHMHFKS